VLCIVIYICLRSCTTLVSHLLPFMADITCSHCFKYISIAVALHGCITVCTCLEPVFQWEFNRDIYLIIRLTCLVIWRINEYLYAFCIIFQYKFNYNICLVIRLTCFGNFGKLLICIYILYCFSMWIIL